MSKSTAMQVGELVCLLKDFETKTQAVRGEKVASIYLSLNSDGSGHIGAEIRSNFAATLEHPEPIKANFTCLSDMKLMLRGEAAIDWLCADDDVV